MSQKPFLKSRFFKLPEHRRFDFPARYYDADKERLEQRKKAVPLHVHGRNTTIAYVSYISTIFTVSLIHQIKSKI